MKSVVLIFVSAFVASASMTTACSSSDDSANGGSGCAPAGLWQFQKPSYKSGTGKACTALGTEISAGGDVSAHLFTLNQDGTYTESIPGDQNDTPVTLTFDAGNCTLTGDEPPSLFGQATDDNGKAIDDASFASHDVFTIRGNSISLALKATITTKDPEAKGFPCEIDGSASGTKSP